MDALASASVTAWTEQHLSCCGGQRWGLPFRIAQMVDAGRRLPAASTLASVAKSVAGPSHVALCTPILECFSTCHIATWPPGRKNLSCLARAFLARAIRARICASSAAALAIWRKLSFSTTVPYTQLTLPTILLVLIPGVVRAPN